MSNKNQIFIFVSIVVIIIAILSCEKRNERTLNSSKINSVFSRNVVAFYGDDVEIVVDTSGDHIIVHRRSLSPNSTNEALFFDMSLIDLFNGFMVFDPQKTYWLIPFDMAAQALVVTMPPDCKPKSCGGTCTLERQSNGCLRCECSTSGDCDMVIGYAFDNGVLIEGDEIDVIDQ